MLWPNGHCGLGRGHICGSWFFSDHFTVLTVFSNRHAVDLEKYGSHQSFCDKIYCLTLSVALLPFAAHSDTGVATKSLLPRYWRCHHLTLIFLYMHNERRPQWSCWECSTAFIDIFQRHKQVFMLIITWRKQLLKQDSPLMMEMFAC